MYALLGLLVACAAVMAAPSPYAGQRSGPSAHPAGPTPRPQQYPALSGPSAQPNADPSYLFSVYGQGFGLGGCGCGCGGYPGYGYPYGYDGYYGIGYPYSGCGCVL
ncbi:keratin-associated protein 19-3-like [Homalodisca vitripennis]|uniref:keratin-associated protein 19-3-like n=1 Tax=Homalodisca vitripennis TaxID=197043 RepID=UPI001EEA99CD|nr:keratin-associated protein 19-3-like [Homalodisca vitripennis]KAG8325341.1 hypothetical protein J6590_070147 [Homalodisca vitripennis]